MSLREQYSVMALSHSMTDGVARLSHEVEPPALNEAKLHLARGLAAELNNVDAASSEIASQLMTVGRRISPLEAFARIDAVDSGAIKHAMRRFCWDHCHVLSSSGKVYELQDYNCMLNAPPIVFLQLIDCSKLCFVCDRTGWRRRSFRLRY
jgi:hypothetical protein